MWCNADFYPRSPCGERPASDSLSDTSGVISIHALLAESDKLIACHNGQLLDFYPRSPCGERRLRREVQAMIDEISIHALLAESDFGLARLASGA